MIFRLCWQLLLSSLSGNPAQRLGLTDPHAPDEAIMIIIIVIIIINNNITISIDIMIHV